MNFAHCSEDDVCDRCYDRAHPPAPLKCPCCGVSETDEDDLDLVNNTWCGPCLSADCREQQIGSPCIAGDR